MTNLKLINFEGCPNVAGAKDLLSKVGNPPFDLIKQDELAAEDPFRRYASPTLHLDGEITFGSAVDSAAWSCTAVLPIADHLRLALYAELKTPSYLLFRHCQSSFRFYSILYVRTCKVIV